MGKRINVIVPEKTVSVLDRVTTKGGRVEFISRAVLYFVETAGRANLRARLKEEAILNAERDAAIAAEWFPLEEEISKSSSSRVAKRKTRFADPPHPREVVIQAGKSGLTVASAVVLNQIRSIDRQRLVKTWGAVEGATLRRVDEALRISLGLVEL